MTFENNKPTLHGEMVDAAREISERRAATISRMVDEPTSALDPELVSDVNDTITKVAGTGVTMIIVTHEIRFAKNVSDCVVFVDKGAILEQGTPQEVIDQPQTARVQEFLSKMALK